MNKRVAAFFSIFMICMFLLLMDLYHIATGSRLAETADRQGSYRLTVASGRGTIYDAKLNPFTGTEKGCTAVISSTPELASVPVEVLPRTRMEEAYTLLTKGKSFLLEPPKAVSAGGIDTFETNRYYDTSGQVAANVVGYLDGGGMSVAGIGKVYQEFLFSDPEEVAISYWMDVVSRISSGENKEVADTPNKSKKSVVLTLDAEVQALAEQPARKYLKKGAVVIVEIPSRRIRVMVSLPNFPPNDPQSMLDNLDSSLLNHAIPAYSVGSVFKVISAAAAFEGGVPPSATFTCIGGIEVGGGVYHCYNDKTHGASDIQDTIAQSCNTYFIKLVQQVPNEIFPGVVKPLGFDQSLTLAPGYVSTTGSLSEKSKLSVLCALTNFSFGQDVLTMTPVQIAGLVNTITSGGLYTPPSLVQELVDENLRYVEAAKQARSVQVMSQDMVAQLRQSMGVVVEDSIAKKGKPVLNGAGVKTGAAQTGQFEGSKGIVQGWYMGFFPFESPHYSIVALSENAQEASGGTLVFQETANALILETS